MIILVYIRKGHTFSCFYYGATNQLPSIDPIGIGKDICSVQDTEILSFLDQVGLNSKDNELDGDGNNSGGCSSSSEDVLKSKETCTTATGGRVVQMQQK